MARTFSSLVLFKVCFILVKQKSKGFGFFFGDVRWGSIRERSIGEGKGSISHANLTLVSANVFFFIYFVMAFVIMEFRTQK